MIRCPKCGAELSDGSKFCSYCGNKIEVIVPPPIELEIVPPPIEPDTEDYDDTEYYYAPQENQEEYEYEESYETYSKTHSKESFFKTNKKTNKRKSPSSKTRTTKGAEYWNKLSNYSRIVVVSMSIIVLLALLEFSISEYVAGVIALFQVALIIVSILIHKDIIKFKQKPHRLEYIVLIVAILLTFLTIMSNAWGTDPSSQASLNNHLDMPGSVVADSQSDEAAGQSLSITKGTEYAYMTDPWNVYIATAVSNNMIKIENWHKTSSSDNSVSYKYDVGVFKINDEENKFIWADDEHTTFAVTFEDESNSSFRNGGTAIFTINISEKDINKGSDYSEGIACYSFQNDNWHLYRAIPMSDTIIKIECWYRGSSADDFLFGYDVGIIDTANGQTDFEWTDDEHVTFSISMIDSENSSYWKDVVSTVYILENDSYKYSSVKSYLGKWEVGEGEAAVPASASDYVYENYLDVQKELEDAGFTNITTDILYDIVWGITPEGEVESVSVDGRTDYKKGNVFNQDVPIVITYHMKKADAPEQESSQSGSEAESSDSLSGAEVSNTEEYALDKDLTVTMCEVDSNYKTMYNVEFGEFDDNGNQVGTYSFGNCINPRAMGDEFNAIGGLPDWFYVGAVVHVTANFSNATGTRLKDCTVTKAEGSAEKTTSSSNSGVILPQQGSKLSMDYELQTRDIVIYMNVDGTRNVPSLAQWESAVVTDGVAEYLTYLTDSGCSVKVEQTESKEPYAGFNLYETKFSIESSDTVWTMNLSVESEKYVEYELDINLP